MKIDSITLADMLGMECIRPDLALMAKRIIATSLTYEDWVDVLNLDLDVFIRRVEEDPKVHQNDSEDRLTTELINMLHVAGYDASHDELIGGHSDIVIRTLRGFLWVGEAKIHGDYAYMMKGFNQLSTRYMIGTVNADQGALLMYIRNKNTKQVVSEWSQRLTAVNLPGFNRSDCGVREELGFYSEHEHYSTGRIAKIRHIGIKQHWDPQDVDPKIVSNIPPIVV